MKNILLVIFALIGLYFYPSHSNTITGKVITITNGDTVKILTADKQTHKIRLHQIDTPEKKQPCGQKAKQALSEKIYRKTVEIEIETTDHYGRLIGSI